VLSADTESVIVLAATGTEARPLRRRLRGHTGVTVVRTGVGLTAADHGAALISCGVAGGLDRGIGSGTLVVPDAVGTGDGVLHRCDSDLVRRLRAAAEACGVDPHPGPLLTLDHMVTGAERTHWAAQGYAAVDMESALMVGHSPRFAAVRVVLDTPDHELSPRWVHPLRALLAPSLWTEALWLARVAPRHCDVAACIVAAAF
jgi:4-hydroxy-3-methylbut-2-enyl diphosphate reductase